MVKANGGLWVVAAGIVGVAVVGKTLIEEIGKAAAEKRQTERHVITDVSGAISTAVTDAVERVVVAMTPEVVQQPPAGPGETGMIEWGNIEIPDPTDAYLPPFESRPDYELLPPGGLEELITEMTSHDPKF